MRRNYVSELKRIAAEDGFSIHFDERDPEVVHQRKLLAGNYFGEEYDKFGTVTRRGIGGSDRRCGGITGSDQLCLDSKLDGTKNEFGSNGLSMPDSYRNSHGDDDAASMSQGYASDRSPRMAPTPPLKISPPAKLHRSGTNPGSSGRSPRMNDLKRRSNTEVSLLIAPVSLPSAVMGKTKGSAKIGKRPTYLADMM